MVTMSDELRDRLGEDDGLADGADDDPRDADGAGDGDEGEGDEPDLSDIFGEDSSDEDDEDDDGEGDPAADEQPRKSGRSAQRKIRKLTKRAADAKREAEYWRTRAMDGGDATARRPEKDGGDGGGDAEDWDPFDRTKVDKAIERAVAGALGKQQSESEAQGRVRAAAGTVHEAIEAAGEKAPYARALLEPAVIDQRTGDLVSGAVVTREAAIELARHKEHVASIANAIGRDATRIRAFSRMSPTEQVAHVARLAGRFEHAAAGTKRKTSPAQPTLSAGRGGVGRKADPQSGFKSQRDYEAWEDRTYGKQE